MVIKLQKIIVKDQCKFNHFFRGEKEYNFKNMNEVDVVIEHTGDVLFVPPLAMEIQCPRNKTHIICTYKFGSWTFDKANVRILKPNSGEYINDLSSENLFIFSATFLPL